MRSATTVLMGAVLLAASNLSAAEMHRVVEVPDTQTLVLEDGERIHLIGIEMPPEKSAADDAVEFLRNIILNKTVDVEQDPIDAAQGYRDAEGQRLAYIWYAVTQRVHADGPGSPLLAQEGRKLLNMTLLENGWVRYRGGMDELHGNDMLAAQDAARQMKLGIWRDSKK